MITSKAVTQKQTKMPFGRLLAWNMRPISLGAVTIIIAYFSTYCTDTLEMPAALVGTLLMASKIFDSVTDLVSGWIVDNTNTKLGKGRPYEISIIGVWFFTWLMFSASPEWSLAVKSGWLFCTYTFVWSVFSTLLNAAETPYMIRAFHTREIIVKVSSFGGLIIMIGSMIVSISFPLLMRTMATSAAGWSRLIGIFAIVLSVIGLLRFFFVPEDNPDLAADAGGERLRVKEIFYMMRHNKYAWYYSGIRFVHQMILGMTVASYYFIWVVGDIGKYSTLLVTSMVAICVILLFPVLLKKMSMTKLVIIFSVISIIGYGINFFALDNMPMLIVGFILAGLFQQPLSYLQSLYIMDCASYNEYLGNKRMESSVSAMGNFLSKLGGAFGSLVMGILLSVGGYVGTLDTQPDSAIFMIRLLYSVVPIIALAIMIVLCVMYQPLHKLLSDIEAKKSQVQ